MQSCHGHIETHGVNCSECMNCCAGGWNFRCRAIFGFVAAALPNRALEHAGLLLPREDVVVHHLDDPWVIRRVDYRRTIYRGPGNLAATVAMTWVGVSGHVLSNSFRNLAFIRDSLLRVIGDVCGLWRATSQVKWLFGRWDFDRPPMSFDALFCAMPRFIVFSHDMVIKQISMISRLHGTILWKTWCGAVTQIGGTNVGINGSDGWTFCAGGWKFWCRGIF